MIDHRDSIYCTRRVCIASAFKHIAFLHVYMHVQFICRVCIFSIACVKC